MWGRGGSAGSPWGGHAPTHAHAALARLDGPLDGRRPTNRPAPRANHAIPPLTSGRQSGPKFSLNRSSTCETPLSSGAQRVCPPWSLDVPRRTCFQRSTCKEDPPHSEAPRWTVRTSGPAKGRGPLGEVRWRAPPSQEKNWVAFFGRWCRGGAALRRLRDAPRDAVRGLDSALALVGASAAPAHPTEGTHRSSAQIGSPAGRVSGRLHARGARAGCARRSHVQDQWHRAALLDQFRDPDAAADMAVRRQHHGCGACWEDDHPTRVWRSVVHPAGILAGWGGSAQPRGIGRRRDHQSLRQTPQSGWRCARPRSALPRACLPCALRCL